MNDKTTLPPADRKDFLTWLGLKRHDGNQAMTLAELAAQLRASEAGSRAEIVAGIAEFLDRHNLDICSHVLGIAYDYVTESDTMLVRMINERELIGQAVTIEWLRQVANRRGDRNGIEEIYKVFEKLERHLIDFGIQASTARRATVDYGASLKDHAEQLENSSDIGQSVSQLMLLVDGMIARTAELEREMDRSEQNSRFMRNSLEAALRAAEEDQLTGLPNRRAFERTFAKEFLETRQGTESLILAFCDIDHFKHINDTHGHDTGDRVLRAVANKLAGISSDRCFVARHGGEEFVVLFRGKTLDQARKLLDRTREELSGRRLINRQTKEPIGFVTFSAGIGDVADFPSSSAALKAVDTALYAAKGQGRNRIVVASMAQAA
jgi:diguanylate cyclase